MEVDTGEGPRLLSDLRRRRAELREAMSAVELALASPAPATAPAIGTHWAEWLRMALVELYEDFGEHVVITEGPGGLYCEVTRSAPRLTGRVERLTREHVAIRRQTEELLTWLDANDDLLDVGEARRMGTELLVALMRHRQRGADLVFEAYQVDIGGET